MWWPLAHISTDQPQAHMRPAPILNCRPASLPTHPSGLSLTAGFECPASCTECALVVCLTYGNVHVSVYSLVSSHPRLLPHSPVVCSLHLCFFCCLHIGLFLPSLEIPCLNIYIYIYLYISVISSVVQSCLTLCDPMNCSTPVLPVHHQLLEFTQTHVH